MGARRMGTTNLVHGWARKIEGSRAGAGPGDEGDGEYTAAMSDRQLSRARRGAPRVLVTAFEPFDGNPANRSERWLERFLGEARDTGLAYRVDLAAALLPVDCVRLPRALAALVRRLARAPN